MTVEEDSICIMHTDGKEAKVVLVVVVMSRGQVDLGELSNEPPPGAQYTYV